MSLSHGPEQFERPALLASILAPRRTTRQTMAVATLFAIQAIICAILLAVFYRGTQSGMVKWAIVSAILVLQPGIDQSVSASIVRIVANIIGAIAGFLVGWRLGAGLWQVGLALIIVTYICEFLRLDLGLRTACVSVVIVMLNPDGKVGMASWQRSSAVIIGCAVAIIVQMIFDRLTQALGMHPSKILQPTQPRESTGQE